MSFLTPLYLLGLAAVSLPILFHLIRRTPRGRFNFSSLMFLASSPPRLTRRSRLDNLLLLLLRAAILILLAIAFARPFLRSIASASFEDRSLRKICILIDTSASMQRDDLWQQAQRHVASILDDLGPGDDVALLQFARDHETLVSFEDLALLDTHEKVAQVQTALQSLHPGWAATDLGQALIAAADEVDQAGATQGTDTTVTRQVVLISDLQEGSDFQALRSYTWPDDVQLAVRPVRPVGTNNAGLHAAAALEEPADSELRVRITNSSESLSEQFQLQWSGKQGRTINEPIDVYVPTDESRVVRMPTPPDDSGADRLILHGDDHDFDNTLYLMPPRRDSSQVLYLGYESAEDPQGLRYYLARAFPVTPRRSVTVTFHPADQAVTTEQLADVRMVVLQGTPSAENIEHLRAYVKRGGTLLIVLTDAADQAGLTGMLQQPIEVTEAEVGDYVLLGEIDFADSLFAPFADPRYNDFTGIHFWKCRRLELPAEVPAKVLARFDNRDPALVDLPIGSGRAMVLTSGWQPRDSQLSRSTKFVPLLAGLLERGDPIRTVASQYDVGQAVPVPSGNQFSGEFSVTTPDGAQLLLPRSVTTFTDTDRPGIYQLVQDNDSQAFAVNVAAQECKTAPMSTDLLVEQGVSLGTATTRAERAEKQRQLRDIELEERQKLWQWLIVTALGLLILETWVAGSLARQTSELVRA